MKKYMLSIFLVFILWSCSEKPIEPSLSEERLIPLLVDIHIAEAATQSAYGTIKDSLLAIYYEQIYEMHDITATEVEENLLFLRKHPDYTNTLYEKVLEEIDKKEANAIEKETEEQSKETTQKSLKKGK